MDERRARRSRSWILLGVVVVGVPVLAFASLVVAYAIVMSAFG